MSDCWEEFVFRYSGPLIPISTCVSHLEHEACWRKSIFWGYTDNRDLDISPEFEFPDGCMPCSGQHYGGMWISTVDILVSVQCLVSAPSLLFSNSAVALFLFSDGWVFLDAAIRE